ncbi:MULTISPECIES: hypothetical protein [Yersinia]|nr:hypothetical protein [Yersinia mollaretii]HEI6798603.1 hypothetical protein [Yersinia enterocolitica]MDA5529078.1 hypothetical protein [Yersinia mollaretii]MDR7875840.1 hypothetical protein [Yersinia mollaretii]WQC74057.1 hypothetical protein U1Z61_16695 [Yersinia mollaretii]WQC76894.1 hypothetical protein U1Z61_10615 [Yersinia mollaretii]
MSIHMIIECKKVDEISVTRMGEIEIELTGADLVDAVDIETIVKEYGATNLLDEINETDVISWLENQGYTVTE